MTVRAAKAGVKNRYMVIPLVKDEMNFSTAFVSPLRRSWFTPSNKLYRISLPRNHTSGKSLFLCYHGTELV